MTEQEKRQEWIALARARNAPTKDSGYDWAGASHNKRAFQGLEGRSGSPAEDINENLYTLRQRSRLLAMAAPMAVSAIKNNRTAIVGTGMVLKATPDYQTLGWTSEQAEQWARQVENEFALFADDAESCDLLGVNDFYQMQQVAALGWLAGGDIFNLFDWREPERLRPYGLRLHLVEAERCRTPAEGASALPPLITTAKLANGNHIYDGVEVDKSGHVVAYHFCSQYPYDYLPHETPVWTRVAARDESTGLPNVLIIMDCERAEQYRGVPYLAPVIEPLLQYNRYTNAEVTAAVIQSFYTAYIKTENPNGQIMPQVGQVEEIKRNPLDYQMGAGDTVFLDTGEDIVFNNPTHPSSSFDSFTSTFANLLGGALEQSGSLILKKFTSNYTAARGELMEAWKAFKMRREWLATRFCQPVYERFLFEAVARGRVPAPGFFTDPRMHYAYLRASWVGPSQGQLDPKKEVEAAQLAIQLGLSTGGAESVKLNGSEYSENIAELAAEKALRERLGVELNAPAVSADEPEEEDEE